MAIMLEGKGLTKKYPGQAMSALGDPDPVSFEVEEGALFALLGPSGCGKTTILRIVGGFETPSSGQVIIDGQNVTDRAAHRRPTNTVFQSYALFPHLRLGANIEFGLKLDRIAKAERDKRVGEVLELVGLGGWQRRRVTELSGGQQQRAALARAMVNQPKILLLDEPLGALDLKLRRQMQDELVRLKGSTATTFVHVTHDQEEACAIADTIAVMDKGRIVQVDTPVNLYKRPLTSYVASFINAGTLIRGNADWTTSATDHVVIANNDVVVAGTAPARLRGTQRVAAVLPPSRIQLSRQDIMGKAVNEMYGTITHLGFTGASFDITVRGPSGFVMRVSKDSLHKRPLNVGDTVRAYWDPEDLMFVEDTDES